jgi:nitrate reductase NapAB chaperone NapD
MIASLVATLDRHVADLTDTVSQISRIPCVELSDEKAFTHRLPVMIDSPDPDSLEDITRRLQQIPGVAFVDVVFVHFEDESDRVPATQSGKPTSL